MIDILVDEAGARQIDDKIDEIRNAIINNGKKMSESYNDYIGDGWHDNPAYEESMRKNRMLNEELDRILKQKKKIKIVKNEYDNSKVNLGDYIRIEFFNFNDETEYEDIKLTGKYFPDIDNDEISLNSPLGRCIYKKKIGEMCSYIIDKKEIKIKIIGRIK